MEGASDYDIAACLRHSSTALVRRYAHLSPTHLKGVMEKVSSFGIKRRKDSGSIETVTETVTRENAKGEETVQVVKYGAPGRT